MNAITSNARPDYGRSWIAPNVKKGDLLYVSDAGTEDVYVFSYPTGRLKGKLVGFSQPQGLCADVAGNVFIANAGASEIIEYAHAGTSPIATLSDATRHPIGCSVDATTGNLAVSNFEGSVSIFKSARGKPKTYIAHNIILTGYFCSYDDEGNLYFDGSNDVDFALVELPKGHNRFTTITLNRIIYFPGGVQWDGKYLAVGEQGSGYGSTIYDVQITKSGAAKSEGTVVRTIPLNASEDCLPVLDPGKDYHRPRCSCCERGIMELPRGWSTYRNAHRFRCADGLDGQQEPVGVPSQINRITRRDLGGSDV